LKTLTPDRSSAFLLKPLVAIIGGAAAGVAASVPHWGALVTIFAGGLFLSVLDPVALFSFIVVSAGVSLSFITDSQRTLLPGLGGATVEGLRLAGVLGAFAVAAMMGRSWPRNIQFISPYLFFLSIAAASIVWSPDKGAGLRLFSRLVYPAVAFAVCYGAKGEGERLFRDLCCWAAATATIVNGYLAAREIMQSGWLEYGLRYHGSSGPMDFGLFCAAGGLTLYGLWTRYRQKHYLLLAVILGIQLVATGTRTSTIAGTAGLIIFELLQRRRARAGFISAAAVAIWLLVPTLGTRTINGGPLTGGITAPGGVHVNLSGREILWDDVRNNLIGDPTLLGHGLGATQRFMSSRYILPRDVHNSYLLILADTGIVGLTAYFAFLFLIGGSLLKRLRDPQSGTLYASLCLSLLAIVALSGIVQNPLYVYGAAPMFLFVTLALSFHDYPSQRLAPLGDSCG
jgi:hypothetical protein